MLCRAVRDEAAADSVWQCAGVRCSSQVAGLLAAVRSAVARSGKAVQVLCRLSAKVLCGLLCRLLWVLRWQSLAKMLCMPGKGSLCRVLGNQQVLELRTRGFKIEKKFVSNV